MKQKVWFISGCSTGFGRELAQQVLQSGDKVIATARQLSSIEDLKKHGEGNVLTLALDVTKKEQVKEAVSQAIEVCGKVDVLVNNAGIGYFSSVEESIEEEARKMFEVNFWGLMNLTNELLPHMRSKRDGHIINLSSIGGLASFPSLGYYHATKYAVEGISESLSQELASYNVKVTLIEPSAFRTDWGGRSSEKTVSELYSDTAGQFINDVVSSVGKEPGDPAKAAQAIITLVNADEPPSRLLLGKIAYDVAKKKFNDLLKDIEAWKETTVSADYEK
ncbi:oxidoreductase [Paenibacillus illinoisensis]|uniref:oxidoreductase n=1 Tax=Paenibacillus illinoisensis TaxID=59845 RepID=UPI00289F4833|nr:oxidoreductase [Paenibacillus illinoisensis]